MQNNGTSKSLYTVTEMAGMNECLHWQCAIINGCEEMSALHLRWSHYQWLGWSLSVNFWTMQVVTGLGSSNRAIITTVLYINCMIIKKSRRVQQLIRHPRRHHWPNTSRTKEQIRQGDSERKWLRYLIPLKLEKAWPNKRWPLDVHAQDQQAEYTATITHICERWHISGNNK